MGKIKETITALTNSSTSGIVRISRKEQSLVPYEWAELIFKFTLKISSIASATAIVLYVEFWKMVALFVFAIFFTIIYTSMKD